MSAASVLAVCEYCTSTILRKGEALENIGKMAALQDDPTLLRIGTRMLSLPTFRRANSPRCANTRLSIFRLSPIRPAGHCHIRLCVRQLRNIGPVSDDASYLTQRLQFKTR